MRRRDVENGLRPESQPDLEPTWTLTERMDHYRVPGGSVAVISGFEVDWANGYGVARACFHETCANPSDTEKHA